MIENKLTSTATGLLLAVMILTVAWSQQNRTAMLGDSYGYLTHLLSVYNRADNIDSLSDAWHALGQMSLVGRPPLYQLATVPMIALFGPPVLVNLLFLALLGVSTYHVGRLVRSREAGLLASLVVLTYPPIVHLSRIYGPHFALAAWSALTLWILLSLIDKRSIAGAWLLGLSLACGLWTHPYFVCVSVVPTIVVGFYLLASAGGTSALPPKRDFRPWLAAKLGDRFVLLGLLPAAVIAVASLAAWYGIWGSPGFDQLESLRNGRQGRIGFLGIAPSMWWYARTAPGAITNVLAVFTAVGCLYALFETRWKGRLLVLTLLCAYLVLSHGTTLGWVYFAGALPVAAVLGTSWIFGIRRRWLRWALTAVAAGTAAFSFSFVTWEGGAWQRSLSIALGSPLTDHRTCSNGLAVALCRAPTGRWQPPWPEIRDLILDNTGRGRQRRERVLVLKFFPNAPQALIHAMVSKGSGPRFSVLRFGELPRRRPYDFGTLLTSDFVIYSDRFDDRFDSRRYYDKVTTDFLRSPPVAFADAHRVIASFESPIPAIGTLRVLQRVRPLSVEEAEQTLAALDLSPRAARLSRHNMVQLYVSLARRDDREGSYNSAIRALQQALAESPDSVQLRLSLAKTYRKTGDGDAALRELLEAVAQAPRMVRPRLALARAYISSEKTAEAIAVYREVLRIDSSNAFAAKELKRLERPKKKRGTDQGKGGP